MNTRPERWQRRRVAAALWAAATEELVFIAGDVVRLPGCRAEAILGGDWHGVATGLAQAQNGVQNEDR